MFQERRPTCVTVIGWAWIVIGTLLALSSVFSLLTLVMWQGMGAEAGPGAELPLFFRLVPILTGAQLIVGVAGALAGVSFLRLRAAARAALEALTWLLLVGVVGFMVFWLSSWLTQTSTAAPAGFMAMGAAMGVVVTFFYGVPLGIMLAYLRGPKVRGAVTG